MKTATTADASRRVRIMEGLLGASVVGTPLLLHINGWSTEELLGDLKGVGHPLKGR